MAEDIRVTFVIPKTCKDENDCSEEMLLAFTACEQHSGGGLQAEWIHESQCTKCDGLTKRDVFVLSDFEGGLYEKLRIAKCLVVGPRCLSCCLTEGVPIPSGPEPVYTVAMRGLVVTASGLSKQQKENIKKKVHWMGGIYNPVLTEDTTHLISDTVLSDKYIKSIEKAIPVMSETWIEAVWEASLQLNVNGSSPDFNKHYLLPFTNLQVTTSGLLKKDKQMVMKLVNENGGTFTGSFQSETTDIVVLNKDGVGSEKYKAALEYGKACVLPTWVKDSAAKGLALPLAKYRVAGASTSSPLAEHRLPDMSLNFSRITNVRPQSNFVDESRTFDISTMSGKMKLSQEAKSKNDTSVEKDLLSAFENFDVGSIKKAGPIFDGFCIWVTGLEGTSRERAAAMVSKCGGVRYDCPHDRVTHTVAGSRGAAAAALRALPNVPVLTAKWLIASVEAGRPMDEAEFLLDTKPATPVKSAKKPRIEAASPMSKRNLQLLRIGPLDLPPPTPVIEPAQDEIVNHYLSQNIPEPVPEEKPEERPHSNASSRLGNADITEDLQDEPTEEIEQIFRGQKIEVHGLDEEAICEIGAEVAAAGGVLVAAGCGGRLALVPLDMDGAALPLECVTIFYVRDCLSQQELLPVQYYHRPVRLPEWAGEPPLLGVVASLSTYSGVERAFLDELAKLLGATTELRFCRRNTANALASTHLICPTPSGDKYLGAVKWGLPAVKASWLLACAEAGRRVSEKEHLVGETKAPESPEPQEETREMSPEQEKREKENVMLPPVSGAVPRRGSVPSREQTPKGKDPDDMSPASRYIAMARQGLLGGDTQDTPTRLQDLKDEARQAGELRTPPLDEALSTPNMRGLSPTTRRRLQAVRRGEMPSDPIRTPTDPFDKNPDTPDSAFGAALRPGSEKLSPDARKRLWKVVNDLPSKQPQPARDKHTPLSEIRNRFLAQFNSDSPAAQPEHSLAPRKLQLQDQVETPPSKMAKMHADQSAGSNSVITDSSGVSTPNASKLPAAVDAQLQRLSAALSSCTSQRRRPRDSGVTHQLPETEGGPESQPNTVGWDDATPPSVKRYRFMLSSNVDNREEIIEMIQHLGGEVSQAADTDPEATHLLCAAPSRSEKMLGSVAAGRWVLHPAYVARSRTHGSFLPEEDYEWGNPRATCLPNLNESEKSLARAAYRWRSNRVLGLPGPFAGLVALLHVPEARRRLLARLIIEGDGQAPDLHPPYDSEEVTVCFADVKRYPLSARDAAWLVSHRIPVCAPVLLSSFLTDDLAPNPVDRCLPEFRPK